MDETTRVNVIEALANSYSLAEMRLGANEGSTASLLAGILITIKPHALLEENTLTALLAGIFPDAGSNMSTASAGNSLLLHAAMVFRTQFTFEQWQQHVADLVDVYSFTTPPDDTSATDYIGLPNNVTAMLLKPKEAFDIFSRSNFIVFLASANLLGIYNRE